MNPEMLIFHRLSSLEPRDYRVVFFASHTRNRPALRGGFLFSLFPWEKAIFKKFYFPAIFSAVLGKITPKRKKGR